MVPREHERSATGRLASARRSGSQTFGDANVGRGARRRLAAAKVRVQLAQRLGIDIPEPRENAKIGLTFDRDGIDGDGAIELDVEAVLSRLLRDQRRSEDRGDVVLRLRAERRVVASDQKSLVFVDFSDRETLPSPAL